MKTTQSHAWTIFLDGRTHQVVLEIEHVTSMFSNQRTHRVLVNGSVVVSGPPAWNIKFPIGRSKCKIRLDWRGHTPEQLLVDGRDAGEFPPPAHYFAPEPRGGAAPASAAREQQLESALEALQDRLLRGEISENVYTELKEALVRRYESGADLAPARSEKVIERQLVVMHCKFCNELTPVDLSACKSCGAGIR